MRSHTKPNRHSQDWHSNHVTIPSKTTLLTHYPKIAVPRIYHKDILAKIRKYVGGVFIQCGKTKNNPHVNRQETGDMHRVHPEPVRAEPRGIWK